MQVVDHPDPQSGLHVAHTSGLGKVHASTICNVSDALSFALFFTHAACAAKLSAVIAEKAYECFFL